MSLNEIKDVKLSIKRSDGALHYFYKPFVHFSFWLRWVFVAALGLSLGAARGAYAWLQCSGFSCCRAGTSGHTGFSGCGSRALDHRLSSCGAGA